MELKKVNAEKKLLKRWFLLKRSKNNKIADFMSGTNKYRDTGKPLGKNDIIREGMRTSKL